MSVTLEVLDPRHDPEPAYWQGLTTAAQQHLIWSYELLRIAAWTVRSPLLLAVLRDGPDPIGVVCASLTGIPIRRGCYVPAAGGTRIGVLDVHAPMAPTHAGWWFTDRPTGGRRRELFHGYVTAMRRLLGTAVRGVLWRQVPEADRPLLPGRLRLAHPLNPIARLATPWPDTDGWYAAMSRSRRQSMLAQRRRLMADGDLETRIGTARELVTALEVARLRRANELKYARGAMPPVPFPLPYLEAMLGRDDVAAITYRDRRSRLLGVGLLLDHPHWPAYHLWGALPAEHGGRPDLYFDGYARTVEWAVERGKTGLIWGKGQTDLKRRLGAELVPNYAVAVPH
jgi:hypothetical protein